MKSTWEEYLVADLNRERQAEIFHLHRENEKIAFICGRKQKKQEEERCGSNTSVAFRYSHCRVWELGLLNCADRLAEFGRFNRNENYLLAFFTLATWTVNILLCSLTLREI